MRYMLLIYTDESQMGNAPEAELEAEMQRWFEYTAAMREAGVSDIGDALQPTATATCVRDDSGQPLVTDGPFAETKEQLGGFYLLEVPDLDAAIKWAHRCPGAKYGTLELRPIVEFPDA